MLFFAGFRAVFFTFKADNALSSSKIAVKIAIISMLIYPVVFIGNMRGWKFPFLQGGISFWVQAHPVYVIFVNIPVLIILIRDKQIPARLTGLPEGDEAVENLSFDLTAREKEIFLLLYQGKRYSEIAEMLFISLPTVKTHVNHIYKKLDVTRREELYRKLQSGS